MHFASRLTGWNAIKSRAEQLELHMADAQLKECTAKVKRLADIRPLAINDVDDILHSFHRTLMEGGAAAEAPAAQILKEGPPPTTNGKAEADLAAEKRTREQHNPGPGVGDGERETKRLRSGVTT